MRIPAVSLGFQAGRFRLLTATALFIVAISTAVLIRPESSHALPSQVLIFDSNEGPQFTTATGGTATTVDGQVRGFSRDGAYFLQQTAYWYPYSVAVRSVATGGVAILSRTVGSNMNASFSTDWVRWSSGGNDLVLKDNFQDLYRASSDGTGQVFLSNTNISAVVADVSPDGSKVAFAGNTASGSELYLVPATGGTPEKLVAAGLVVGYDESLRWLSDGRIFYNCNGPVVTGYCFFDPATPATPPVPAGLAVYGGGSVTWNADATAAIQIGGGYVKLWEPATANLVLIANGLGPSVSATWGQDGSTILILSGAGESAGAQTLLTYQGGSLQTLATVSNAAITRAITTPDGATVYYGVSDGAYVLNPADATSAIYSVPTTGGTATQLPLPPSLKDLAPRYFTTMATDLAYPRILAADVTLDGFPVPDGLPVTVKDQANTTCASGVTIAGGFSLALPASCAPLLGNYVNVWVAGYQYGGWGFPLTTPGNVFSTSFSFLRPIFKGSATVSGVGASDGSPVTLTVGGIDCGTTTTSSGTYQLTVTDNCPNGEGMFTLQGSPSHAIYFSRYSGQVHTIDLNVGDPLVKGSVTIENVQAPDGTSVTMTINGNQCGSGQTTAGLFQFTVSNACPEGNAFLLVGGLRTDVFYYVPSFNGTIYNFDVNLVPPRVYGYAYIDGSLAPDGTMVDIAASGVPCASTTTTGGFFEAFPGAGCPNGTLTLRVGGAVGLTFDYYAVSNWSLGQLNLYVSVPQNPIPSLSALSPYAASVTGPAFTLTVLGSAFLEASVVRWNGTDRPTTFVSSTTLTADIPAEDIATAGTPEITVFTSAPGGGTSNALPFVVADPNPSPTITLLTPSTLPANSPAFVLTVNGTGFVSSSVVQWRGGTRATSYVSPTSLTAQILATDLLEGGPLDVTVISPLPGGGTSSPAVFTLTAPTPVIDALFPSTAIAGGDAFNLVVNGTGFIAGSTVRWDGSPRPTTWVSTTELRALIAGSDFTAVGSASVDVLNAAPGGASNSMNLAIVDGSASNDHVATPKVLSGASFTWLQSTAGFTTAGSDPLLACAAPSSQQSASAWFTYTAATNGVLSINTTGSTYDTVLGVTPPSAATSCSDDDAGNLAGTLKVPTTAGMTYVIEVASKGTGSGGGQLVVSAVLYANPTISTLDPSPVIRGGPAFTLTVNGTGFLSNSVVQWNYASLATLVISDTTVTAAIPSTLIGVTVASLPTITVVNPTTSQAASKDLLIVNPVPSIATMSRTSVVAGGPAFDLTVNGTDFISSTIRWNGVDRPTLRVSTTELTAAISPADIANAGVNSVTVISEGPGGGISNAFPFSVTTPGANTTWYFAEGFTSFGWTTELHILNTNASTANVQVSYLLDSGPPVIRNVTVAGQSKRTLLANDLAEGPGTGVAFGVKLESDLPVMVEEQMFTASGGDFAHGTRGATALSNSWYFAEGFTQFGWQTFVLVANPGAVDAQVTATYQLQTGAPVVKIITVPAGSRGTLAGHADVPDNAFSVRISSTQPVVAEMAMYDPGRTMAHRTVGVTAAGTDWYLGEGFTGAGWETYLSVGNAGASAVTVTATYALDGEASVEKILVIPAGSRGTFIGHLTATGVGPGKAFGVHITSTGPVFVQEVLIDPAAGASRAISTMAAIAPASHWSFSGGSSRTGNLTFITVANPSGVSALVTTVYYFDDGTAPMARTKTIPANSRSTFVSSADVPSGKRFGAVVTSVGGQVVAQQAVYDESYTRAFSASGVPGP